MEEEQPIRKKTGKVVLGREIDKMSQEDIDEMMREWRSRRVGNGMLGKKHSDRILFTSNDFPDPNKTFKPGQLAKEKNEHIKCVFVCARRKFERKTAPSQKRIYLICFLTDSNRYCFEEFYETLSKKADSPEAFRAYLKKYSIMFKRKNIDRDTMFVLCKDGIAPCRNLMVEMLKFMQAFVGFKMYSISKAMLIKRFTKEYRPFTHVQNPLLKRIKKKNETILKNCQNYKDNMLNQLLDNIYEYVRIYKLCPWINDESKAVVWELSVPKRSSVVLAQLGLMFTVMMKYGFMKAKMKKRQKTQ